MTRSNRVWVRCWLILAQAILNSKLPAETSVDKVFGGRPAYPIDADAYQGIKFFYETTGDLPVKGVVSLPPSQARYYWIITNVRLDKNSLVYYIAYNPQANRPEYIIGPRDIGTFLVPCHGIAALKKNGSGAGWRLAGLPA